MRPRKPVLLCCSNEFDTNRLRLVMETRLQVEITVAYGLGIVSATRNKQFHCAVLTHGNTEVIDFLRARGIPTLEIGKDTSHADRCVIGSMMDILEAVRLMCIRKRGPKARAA